MYFKTQILVGVVTIPIRSFLPNFFNFLSKQA